MKFSVFTASTPEWEPAEAAQMLANQGWDGIEWRVTDQSASDEPGFWAGNRATWPLTGLEESLPRIAEVTKAAGLEFSGIGGYARSNNHEDVERMLAATAALGARQVRVTVPPRGDGNYREVFDATRADFEWIATRAAAHGVKALVELHHQTLTASASAALRMVDGLDPSHVGVIHDLGNLLIEGQEDHVSAFQMLGEYLAHIHVKNVAWYPEEPVDGVTTWKEHWAPLATGQADVRAYFRALAAVGYDGWVTLEDFSTELPLEQRTRENLDFVKDAAARAVRDD
ncbi:sugar phosphate isomerase/epimerase [Salinibacterium sp. NK8237]|uniref:sugar phosphate isomerase/epimerase family protein n=1 Tax=Salinibacterium sp. NK8237 TaxID=2792038 RepID=UPI0018CDDFF9|nr:sugar phosphate isomerase/epimerase family protein [Salinibacterium sp. NK8237]MBH0131160.1 sugar phosphate isomerase/epimerase [Salinibacterium sp. NK8237]